MTQVLQLVSEDGTRIDTVTVIDGLLDIGLLPGFTSGELLVDGDRKQVTITEDRQVLIAP